MRDLQSLFRCPAGETLQEALGEGRLSSRIWGFSDVGSPMEVSKGGPEATVRS